MSDIWMQSLTGGSINLVDPVPTEVNFREIVDTLAQINRYCGAALKPVSVALHTMIAFDAAEPDVKPWVLLHDAHEARIGDITTPMQKAMIEIAAMAIGGRTIMRNVLTEIKRRHDIAIYAAAELALPTDAQKEAIKRADIIAMQTERRDFLSPCAKAWAPEVEALAPLRKVYRLRAAADVADDLYALFQRYLPALARHRNGV
jgi:5'-deoxynucleotidase YfbR-like HD superfamily hydrolase